MPVFFVPVDAVSFDSAGKVVIERTVDKQNLLGVSGKTQPNDLTVNASCTGKNADCINTTCGGSTNTTCTNGSCARRSPPPNN